MLSRRPILVAALATLVAASGTAGAATTRRATSTTPIPVAAIAPYEYLGWGSPPPPATVLKATGISDLTLAFMLSDGRCHPAWDGQRPLLGGMDAAAIAAVRAAGGDVDVSFGGWSGNKLGTSCTTVASLEGAYRSVVAAYSLRAIDIDIESTEYTRASSRERVVEALAALQRAVPSLEISVTFDTNESGPDTEGVAMIRQAASLGFSPFAWTIMPFDFGAPVAHMGTDSIRAATGLERVVAAAYHETAAAAYAHVGISSMNGRTDERDETVTIADFRQLVEFASSHRLARLTFWAVNRDRSCAKGLSFAAGSCSGVAQARFAFTTLLAAAGTEGMGTP